MSVTAPIFNAGRLRSVNKIQELNYENSKQDLIQGILNAFSEIERVGKNKYIAVESYRNEEEQFNLQCWALTCESFFDKESWIWLFNHFGYKGDYEFIYFE